MGGKKKPTISQLEKRMARAKAPKKGKKETKKAKMEFAASGELTLKSLDELYKEVRKLKVITPYVVSSMFKIKIGEAKEALRTLEAKGLIKLVAKTRRVLVYTPAS